MDCLDFFDLSKVKTPYHCSPLPLIMVIKPILKIMVKPVIKAIPIILKIMVDTYYYAPV